MRMAGAAMLPILAMVETKPIPVCLKAKANIIWSIKKTFIFSLVYPATEQLNYGQGMILQPYSLPCPSLRVVSLTWWQWGRALWWTDRRWWRRPRWNPYQDMPTQSWWSASLCVGGQAQVYNPTSKKTGTLCNILLCLCTSFLFVRLTHFYVHPNMIWLTVLHLVVTFSAILYLKVFVL